MKKVCRQLLSTMNVLNSSSPAKFYVIPKIHKEELAVTASCSYITKPISTFVDEYLKPIVILPTVLEDSSQFVSDLDRKEIPSDCLLFTADVVNLYPSIGPKTALTGLDKLLCEAKCLLAPLLVFLTRLVLENNFVESQFSALIFLQKK